MHATPSSHLLPPRMEARSALLAFGLNEHYRAGTNAGIPAQWQRFGPHLGHLDHEVRGVSYGIVHNVDTSNNFDYLCAVEVTEFPAGPEGFLRLRIPAWWYGLTCR